MIRNAKKSQKSVACLGFLEYVHFTGQFPLTVLPAALRGALTSLEEGDDVVSTTSFLRNGSTSA